jgi:hypothetical protein
VFLFDEPLSNLDAELRVHMCIEIARREFQARADLSCEAGPNIVESRWVDTALRYCQNKLKC